MIVGRSDLSFIVVGDVSYRYGPVRSSIGGGFAAVAVLTAFLLVADVLVGGDSLFATFTGLCAVGGSPYCELGTPTAAALTLFWYVSLFALAWPLLFGGFTWAIPGNSGIAHGAVFGLILWTGYVVVVLSGSGIGGRTATGDGSLLLVTLLAYLVYGVVLGLAYDYLAAHRTFRDPGSAAVVLPV